jgi:hypothetical protein
MNKHKRDRLDEVAYFEGLEKENTKLKEKIELMKEAAFDKDICGDCIEAVGDGYTVCGDCAEPEEL